MEQRIYLSYPLAIDGPRPPAIPAPSLEEFQSIEKDGASVQHLCLYSHVGSHLDTAAHVIKKGRHITGFAPDELIFTRPALIDLHVPDDAVLTPEDFAPHIKACKGCDLLMLRLGLSSIRADDKIRYSRHSPGLSIEAGAYLLEELPAMRAFGLDAPSLACIARLEETMAVHNTMLAARNGAFLVLEEMKLDGDLSSLKEVVVNPWLVEGMHSGPCSVIGILERGA